MPIEINGLSTNHSSNRQRSEATKSSGDDGKAKQSQSGSTPAASDSVHLSDEARGLQKLEEKANSLPDVDMDRVAEIKTAIENGTYKPDPEKIAEKMLQFDNLL